ncbi:MAG: GspE/PulE family protein [bacterium]
MAQKISENGLFQKTIEQLYIALTGVSSYPSDHPIPLQLIDKSYQMLSQVFKEKSFFTTTVMGETFLVDNERIKGRDGVTSKFASYLNKRNLESLTFSKKLSSNEFSIFLRTLSAKPDILQQKGGVATLLKKKGVRHIKVNDIKYGKIKDKDEAREHIHTLDNEENLKGRSVEIETCILELERIVTKLTNNGTAIDYNQFKNTMELILSSFDGEKLDCIAHKIGGCGENKDNLIQNLIDEFFFDAIAETCVHHYLKEKKIEEKFIQRTLPSKNLQKKFFPYFQKTLIKYGSPDDVSINEEEFFHRIESPPNEKEDISIPHGIEEREHENEKGEEENQEQKKELEKIKAKITDFLAKGKVHEANKLIIEFAQRLDDESEEARKSAAKGLGELITLLNEYNHIKSNSQELSNILLEKLKKESHIDTYLLLGNDFRLMCNFQNKSDAFYIDDTLGYRLYQGNKLNKTQIHHLLLARRRHNRSLQYCFGALKFSDESVLLPFLIEQYKGFSAVNLSEIKDIPHKILNMIPLKFIKHYLVLPFQIKDRKLFTAMDNPRNMDIITELQFIAGCSIIPFIAGEYYLINSIENYYHTTIAGSEVEEALEEITKDEELEYIEEKEEDPSKFNEFEEGLQGPVVKLVNLILKDAITKKASDIHIEPYENSFRIRYRLDGTLITVMNPPLKYRSGVTSRIKIMSRLDIAERRLPQDGRFKIKMDGRYLDFRVSTFPAIPGEKVVLRLLDETNLDTDIYKLGMSNDDLKILITAMHKSKGMILVTGPTGSGKTTTLYSVIQKLNNNTRNIMTAEDPIEYNIAGVNQFQMNPKIGLDFARALRSFLRQDPDIIMMGEIRDLETAEMAVKAALTGHLVLSTLHTNNAAEAITRLFDIGIGPFLTASTVNLIIAQRLMRVICPRCKEKAPPNNFQLDFIKIKKIDISKITFFKGVGCSECNATGYKGREAIFELLPLTHEIREMIIRQESAHEIKAKARELGFENLRNKGFEKVQAGRTTLDEWFRVVL